MKLVALGIGSFGAAATAMAILGSGTASADDYAGQTYADASAAISDAGQTAIVSTVVGDKLPQDECIVASSRVSSLPNSIADEDYPGNLVPNTDEILLALNCNGGVAEGGNPGNSALSPAGREAMAAAQEEAEEGAEAGSEIAEESEADAAG